MEVMKSTQKALALESRGSVAMAEILSMFERNTRKQ